MALTRTRKRRRPRPGLSSKVAGLERQVAEVWRLVNVTAGALLDAVHVGMHHAHGLGVAPFLGELRRGLAPFDEPLGPAWHRRRYTRPIPDGVEPGRCALCGCTDAKACPGGCSWANAEHTICTRCEAELAELRGRDALNGNAPGAPGARQARPRSRTAARPPAATSSSPGAARPAGKGSRRPPAPSTSGSSRASSAAASSAIGRKALGARQAGPASRAVARPSTPAVASPGAARPAGKGASRRGRS